MSDLLPNNLFRGQQAALYINVYVAYLLLDYMYQTDRYFIDRKEKSLQTYLS